LNIEQEASSKIRFWFSTDPRSGPLAEVFSFSCLFCVFSISTSPQFWEGNYVGFMLNMNFSKSNNLLYRVTWTSEYSLSCWKLACAPMFQWASVMMGQNSGQFAYAPNNVRFSFSSWAGNLPWAI